MLSIIKDKGVKKNRQIISEIIDKKVKLCCELKIGQLKFY